MSSVKLRSVVGAPVPWPAAAAAGLAALVLHVVLMRRALAGGMRRDLGRSFGLVHVGWALLAASVIAIALVAWGFRAELIPQAASGRPVDQVQPGSQKYPAPLVLLKVSIGSQPPQVIGALSGGLAQVGLPRKLGSVGLVPRLDKDSVAIQLVQIGGATANGKPLLTELARGTLLPGVPIRFNVTPVPVTVEWTGR